LSEKDKGKGKAPAKTAESKLDSRVRELISLICNLDMMSQQMVQIGTLSATLSFRPGFINFAGVSDSVSPSVKRYTRGLRPSSTYC
jgi:hypothetical protein